MDAIRIEQLTKHYSVGFWRPRPYLALDGLSLSVAQGEVFGFLGPNGAGKTTTLKLLMQLIFPTAGHAEILGKPIGHVAVKRRIGYLPENPYFYDHLSAEELLEYFAGLFGYAGAERRSRAARLLDQVGIGAERRLQLRKFSKGMIQRVGIAQALINDPDVVFFDEPMSGLDPLGRRDIRALILQLRDAGRTVFFSSHVLSDAEALCSRVGIVVAGRLVTSGRLSEMLASHVRGWEVVASGLTADVVERARAGGQIRQAGKRRITAKSANQRRYLDAIEEHDIVFGIGPAGTGKTYLAMAQAVNYLLAKKVSRIILARPAVEAGEKLGFLPGDLQEKVNPYLRPLYDALYDMMEIDKAERFLERGTIEVAPIAFMRSCICSDKSGSRDSGAARWLQVEHGDVFASNPTMLLRQPASFPA